MDGAQLAIMSNAYELHGLSPSRTCERGSARERSESTGAGARTGSGVKNYELYEISQIVQDRLLLRSRQDMKMCAMVIQVHSTRPMHWEHLNCTASLRLRRLNQSCKHVPSSRCYDASRLRIVLRSKTRWALLLPWHIRIKQLPLAFGQNPQGPAHNQHWSRCLRYEKHYRLLV